MAGNRLRQQTLQTFPHRVLLYGHVITCRTILADPKIEFMRITSFPSRTFLLSTISSSQSSVGWFKCLTTRQIISDYRVHSMLNLKSPALCHLEKLMTEFIKHKKVIKSSNMKHSIPDLRLNHAPLLRHPLVCLDKDVFPVLCWCGWKIWNFLLLLLSSHRFLWGREIKLSGTWFVSHVHVTC